MTVSVGDVSATQTKSDIDQIYEMLKLQEDQREQSMATFLETNTKMADRQTVNVMRSEIENVLSDALGVLRKSGQEIRDSGR